MKPTYSGEVQFAGYTDSSRSGPRVTFRLSERADLDKFAGCEGKRYMLALVEIGDDEQPVSECKPREPEPRKPVGPLCKWAAIRCTEPDFQRWVVTQAGPADGSPEEWAAYWVRESCGVGSRTEIDGNKVAETRFHVLIRQPYADWLAAKGQQ